MEATIFRPASFALVFMLRLVKVAARSSAMTWSTVEKSVEKFEVRSPKSEVREEAVRRDSPASDSRLHRIVAWRVGATSRRGEGDRRAREWAVATLAGFDTAEDFISD